jgi:short-subunit dehydrogenase
MNKELFFITGASGKLGLSFISQLKNDGKIVIGLVRKDFEIEGVQLFRADLLNENQILTALKNFDFSRFSTINLIHPVGKFKFEKTLVPIIDIDNDGIDDEVYQTNVLTLKSIVKVLLSRLSSNQKLKVCAFASITDKHNIPFWTSYTKSKNIVRGYLKDLCVQNYLHALMVNVSTVDTGNENLLRPNADKTYWLDSGEIVSQVLPELVHVSSYKEIDLFKEKPDFDKNYYLDHEAILKKWEEEMGEN